MRYTPIENLPRHRDPANARSFGHTLLASALLLAAAMTVVVAVVSPAAAAGIVALGSAALFTARGLRRVHRNRRRDGHTRTVRVPWTGASVEV